MQAVPQLMVVRTKKLLRCERGSVCNELTAKPDKMACLIQLTMEWLGPRTVRACSQRTLKWV